LDRNLFPAKGRKLTSRPAKNRQVICKLNDMPNLITFTDRGLFCEAGNFYIDPWKPVDRAVITHGHSDHASFGHKYYLCHRFTKPILQLRLGDNNYQTLVWNETIFMNSVKLSLHPAGHIIGSSQIRFDERLLHIINGAMSRNILGSFFNGL
jgi:hypothetical protein